MSIEKTNKIIVNIYDIILNYCYLKNIEINFFLSGGKDSRLVFGILNKLDAFKKYNIKLSTKGGPYSGDVIIAKKISDKFNIKHYLIDNTHYLSSNTNTYYETFKNRMYGTNLFVSSKDCLDINFSSETIKKCSFFNHEYCTKENKDIKSVKYHLNINHKTYVNEKMRIENINYIKNDLIEYILKKSNKQNGNLIFKILNKYQYWCVSHMRNNSYSKGFFPNILVLDITMKLLYNCYESDELQKYNKFHTDILKTTDTWLIECPLFNDTWGSANKNNFMLSLPNNISLQNNNLFCLGNSKSSFFDIINKNKNILEDVYNINELTKIFKKNNYYDYQHNYFIFLQVLAHKIIKFDLSMLKYKSTSDLIGNCFNPINQENTCEKIDEKIDEKIYNKILSVMIELTNNNYNIDMIYNQLLNISENEKINHLYKKNIIAIALYLKKK